MFEPDKAAQTSESFIKLQNYFIPIKTFYRNLKNVEQILLCKKGTFVFFICNMYVDWTGVVKR